MLLGFGHLQPHDFCLFWHGCKLIFATHFFSQAKWRNAILSHQQRTAEASIALEVRVFVCVW